MLFKYAFPVPRHGQMISVTKYVESCDNPSRAELIDIFEEERRDAEEKTLLNPSELAWRELKNLEGCLYALKHLRNPDMPKLPVNGMNDLTVFCETELEPSVIRVTVVKVSGKSQVAGSGDSAYGNQ